VSDTYDKYGVRIYPLVASLGFDKTVKIYRFNSTKFDAETVREYGQGWLDSLRRQARALADRAAIIAESGEDHALYFATRMMSKAAYAMRQAQRVEEALRRMIPENN